MTYSSDRFAPLPWPPLSAGFTAIVGESERTFLDTNASAVVKRYCRVEITKP